MTVAEVFRSCDIFTNAAIETNTVFRGGICDHQIQVEKGHVAVPGYSEFPYCYI